MKDRGVLRPGTGKAAKLVGPARNLTCPAHSLVVLDKLNLGLGRVWSHMRGPHIISGEFRHMLKKPKPDPARFGFNIIIH